MKRKLKGDRHPKEGCPKDRQPFKADAKTGEKKRRKK